MRRDLPKTDVTAEPDELVEVMDFLRRHRVSIGIAAVVAIIVIGSLMLYRHRRLQSIELASQTLASARTARDVQTVIDLYGSTPYAPLAMLRLAKMQFNDGDYAGAMQRYDDFLVRFPDHPMRSGAELGRVFCTEAMGRIEEAQRGFASFAARYTNHFLRTHAVFGHARCLEQMGRYGEAKAVYEDFVTAYPDSPAAARAEERLNAVKRAIEKISTEAASYQRNLSGASADSPEVPLSPLPGLSPLQ